MTLLDFFKNSENKRNIIYVLDRLLQIAINGDAINKSRKIDLSLYKILNSSKINQEIIHIGLIPIIRDHHKVSNEFMHFINNLWMYMEYDMNTSFLWAMTSPGLEPDKEKQKSIHQKISRARKEILQYLFDKKIVSSAEYASYVDYKVKKLTD